MTPLAPRKKRERKKKYTIFNNDFSAKARLRKEIKSNIRNVEKCDQLGTYVGCDWFEVWTRWHYFRSWISGVGLEYG